MTATQRAQIHGWLDEILASKRTCRDFDRQRAAQIARAYMELDRLPSILALFGGPK